MASAMAQMTKPAVHAAGNSRRPVLPVLRSRTTSVRVLAAANPGQTPAGTPYSGTPPQNFPPVTPVSGANVPTPGVYVRPASTGGSGTGSGSGAGYGGSGGSSGGSGGSGKRPVGSGGSGSGGGDKMPSGWDWQRTLLIALGIAAAVPTWQYINRRYLFKPEPEHTTAKIDDAASHIKHGKSPLSKATSAVKHVTVEPVVEGYRAIKHSDIVHGAEHKAEDAKDAVNMKTHELAHKAERAPAHAGKAAKHAYENTKEGAEDLAAGAKSKAHDASVKAARAGQRGKEKMGDVGYEAEHAAKSGGKGVLEGIKGAAHKVGKALHVVADSTEKGTKKAVNKAEHALGMKHTPDASMVSSDSKAPYYVAGGTVLTVTALAAALYMWDRKGGDISGKMRKLQDSTKDAAGNAMEKLRRTEKNNTGNANVTNAATQSASNGNARA